MLNERIDKSKVRYSFAQASSHYDDFAYLQRTVATELLARTRLIALQGRVLDLGCGTGFLTHLLRTMGGHTQLIGLDIALPMLLQAQHRLQATANYVCADLEHLPVQTQSIDLLFSSLAMQWCVDLPNTLQDCLRVLKPGGTIAFATFGPATLQELKQAWAAVDNHQHVNHFYTADELTAMLHATGWQAIELSQQVYACQYPSVRALMRELKGIGAHNVTTGRKQQLTGKMQLQKMLSVYPKMGNSDAVLASYEVFWVIAEKRAS